MDKDLLRIVIIAIGAVVILSMILWGAFKGKKKSKNMFGGDLLKNIDPNLVLNTEDDDFDIVPLSSRNNDEFDASQVKTRLNTEYIQEAMDKGVDGDALGDDLGLAEELTDSVTDTMEPVAVEKQLPALLQLSIAAKTEAGFSGVQLLSACKRVGLVYGSVKVFERLDAQNRVDYAMASMLEPGIFPGDNWDTYRCPGVTFFMQPRAVDNAKTVFDEMINTIGQLSALLQGEVLDQHQEPLTAASLQQIEQSLS